MASSANPPQLLRSAAAKLQALRSLLTSHSYAAVIIPTSDAHQSEYVAAHDARREFLSDFTGSAGTAVVTHTHALLWTDGRYFTQAESQLAAPHWALMKDRLPETLTIEKWLAANLAKGDAVGIDAALFSTGATLRMKSTLAAAGIQLRSDAARNPVDEVWGAAQPPPPCAPVVLHGVEFSGEATAAKLARVRAEMAKEGADALVLAACDEVCWAFNIRGGDVDCNPIVLAFGLVTASGGATLFVDAAKLSPSVVAGLAAADVAVAPYEAAAAAVRDAPGRIWLDPASCNYALYEAAEAGGGEKGGPPAPVSSSDMAPPAAGSGGSSRMLQKMSPVQLLKSVKNATEIAGEGVCGLTACAFGGV